ncbi:hypothetical protein J1N35_011425 [Gossypium stocksii]|uniref:Uncharacterized protein n=1 Tax=Gossypium stocksii TaxID=47602 RepID=A0A9D3W3K1_9ROSI|nr:hypothetical protein J1N35_011425 [Gossypium stocksii]
MHSGVNKGRPEESVLIDTGVSNLFILEKVVRKLGLLLSDQTKKIKTMNSKEVPTVGVAQ